MTTYASSKPDELLPSVTSVTDCPHVKQPLPDCYCRRLTNTTIPLVIYFCREFYLQCPVYNSKQAGTVCDNEQQG